MADSQVFFRYDWYVCTTSAGPGESPSTEPDLWEKLEFPAIFVPFLIEKAASILLETDGQHDKANAAAAKAERTLNTLTTRHRDAGTFARPEVMTR